MKKSTFILAGILIALGMPLEAQVDYGEFFLDKAMRVDLCLVGDAREEFVTLDHIYQEGTWPETRARLVEPFENGRYAVKIYDITSNRLIFSRGFDAMFGEYKTTAPALNGTKRVFNRSVRVPFPRRPVLFVIEARDRNNILHPLFMQGVDPSDYHIIRETTAGGAYVYEALKNGPPQKSVDVVFVAEGYRAEDKEKFQADVNRLMGWMFEIEPYKEAKGKFNLTGVLRPSPESAMDEPRQNVFRKTLLNASFNAFDLDRYMLIEDGHRLREVAAEVPYDAIVVLVNSKRYGGGGIYNDYCVTTVDNERSKAVFIHEFGHSFAGLGDEYYASDVSYNDFYPKDVEPLEPNITALLDPHHVKWAHLLSPGIQVPTEYGKERTEALQAEARKTSQEAAQKVESAKAKGASEKEIKKIQEQAGKAIKKIEARIEDVQKEYASVYDKVGVFEGAGYSSKGLYRPMVYCLMISSPKQEFCLVCREAITRMIDYYTGN